jgi:signal transduction histidine kinase
VKRLNLRDRLTLVVTAGAAVALAVLTLGFNLALRSSLDHDADNVLAARASAALGTVNVASGVVRGKEAPDSGFVDTLVWIYSGRRAVERPRAPAALNAAADRLAGGPRQTIEEGRYDIRLLAVPVKRGGAHRGTVVVGLSLAPYERTASRALIASLIFAFAVLLGVLLMTRLVIRGALRPVARMTAEAAEWSEQDIDHRFHAGEPHDELTGLAATFDSLLDRLAATLRHEKRFSAEVSHELRTPLAAIAGEADLALRRERESGEYREALTTIATRARQMQRTVESLLATERAETGAAGTAEAGDVAALAVEAVSGLAAQRGVEVNLRLPARELRVGMDADVAERVLAPLVENACQFAKRQVTINVRGTEDHVEYVVSDDGPGVEADEGERIFEPGVRGSAGQDRQANTGNGGGTGLGLALARRLARAADSEVAYVADEGAFVFTAPRG